MHPLYISKAYAKQAKSYASTQKRHMHAEKEQKRIFLRSSKCNKMYPSGSPLTNQSKSANLDYSKYHL